jgi:hypothetical protein
MLRRVAMRPFVLGLCLTVAVLLPKTGSGQVSPLRTPPPDVTAAAAEWQVNSEPVLVGGVVYYPTRGFRFFDGQVMAQIGIVDRVPVYADSTLEQFSVLYVPVGRDRMREYERRRDRELAGTTGSRAPSFPVQSPSAQVLPDRPVGAVGTTGMFEPSPRTTTVTDVARETAPAPPAVDTAGTIDPGATSQVGTAGRLDRGRSRRALVETFPRPSGPNGVWLEFNGARWYAGGATTSFSPDRFEAVGEYRGFPVYRDKTSGKNEIWVPVVKDGPLALYRKQ